MSDIEIASLSESGQIHLPKQVRKGFKAKDRFAVIRIGESILLKKIEMPDMKEDFKKLLKESRNWSKKKGIKPSDIDNAIRRSRDQSSA